MDSLEAPQVIPPGNSRTFWNCNDPTQFLDPFNDEELTLVHTMAEAACSSTFLFPSTSSTCDSDDSQVRFRARPPSLFDESEGAESRDRLTVTKAPSPEVLQYQSSSSSQFNSWTVSAPPCHYPPGPQGQQLQQEVTELEAQGILDEGQGRVHYGGAQLVPEFLGPLNSSTGHGSQNRNTTTSPPSFRRPDSNNSGQVLKQVVKASWQSANMFEFQRRHKEPLGSPCSVISGFTKVVDQTESYCNMESSFGPSTSAAHEPATVNAHRNGSHNSQESNCIAAGVTVLLKPLTSKRKRAKVPKLSNEVESQRMTHIAVERNRRKQMNEHLAALRALMPGSYVQKGDQASIVGGAIEFVKELEHLLHCLQAQKRRRAYGELSNAGTPTSRLAMPNPEPQLCQLQPPFSFHNPQRLVDQSPFLLQGGGAQMTGSYGSSNQIQMIAAPTPASSSSTLQPGVQSHLRGLDYCSSSSTSAVGEARSDMASVEVKLVPGSDGAALVKIMALRRAGQLLRTVVALESLALTILHTNITTVDHTVLYSFHVQINGTGTGTGFAAPLTPTGLNADHIAHVLHQTFDSLHALQF